MKKQRNLLALLLLIVSPLQVVAAMNDSLGLVLQAGNNIPVSYTGDTFTTSLGFIQIQVSTSGAGCASVNNWMQGSGSFPVSTTGPFPYNIYLNTSTNWTNGRSIAKGLCPSGITSQYMKVLQVWNQVGTHCAVNSNCFAMTCSATGVVSGGLTGTLPTVNCTSA